MKRLLPILIVIAVPLLLGASKKDRKVLLDTLSNWSKISAEKLQLEGAPSTKRTFCAALDRETYEARASFGELVMESSRHTRPALVEVVVSDGKIDSTRFYGGHGPSRRNMNLGVDPVEVGLARELWLASDASYKAAVKQFTAKSADRASRKTDDEPPDWSAATPVKAEVLSATRATKPDVLKAIALDASRALWRLEGLEAGQVHVQGVDSDYFLATSDGTRLIEGEGYAAVYAVATAVRADGVMVDDYMHWIARTTDDLPPKARIVAAVKQMGQEVVERVKARQVGYYEGPVVFEGEAAAAVFRHLIPNELEGTPPPAGPGSTYQQRTRSGPRLGRRLLPSGWKIVDNPTAVPKRYAGGYTYDREGVRAQPVTLVSDGYVRDFVMSRVPRAERKKSNGHARGDMYREWQGRLSHWTVQPKKNLSTRRFGRAVTKAQRQSDVDRVLVVRRLRPGHTGIVPQPTSAVWRDADGNEEPVLSLEFQKVDRRTLRYISAAGGGMQSVPYLEDWSAHFQWATEPGLPTLISAPRLLLLEGIEVVFPGPSQEPHVLNPPPR